MTIGSYASSYRNVLMRSNSYLFSSHLLLLEECKHLLQLRLWQVYIIHHQDRVGLQYHHQNQCSQS